VIQSDPTTKFVVPTTGLYEVNPSLSLSPSAWETTIYKRLHVNNANDYAYGDGPILIYLNANDFFYIEVGCFNVNNTTLNVLNTRSVVTIKKVN
jgi:hypothetical protein